MFHLVQARALLFLVNDVIYKLKWPYLSPRLGENVPFLVNAVILQVKVATFFTASRQERYFCLVNAVIYKLKWPSFTTLSSEVQRKGVEG